MPRDSQTCSRASSRRASALFAVALTLLSAGCSHATAVSAAPTPTYPSLPETPRARWSATLTAETAAPEVGFWGKLLGLVVGASNDHPRGWLRPFGLTSIGDTIVLADPDGPTVWKMNGREGSSSQVSCDDHPWEMPMAVALDGDRNLFVADGDRVIRVAREGGCTRFSEKSLQRPTGLAVSAGRLYAVDPPAHAVVVFSLDGRELFRFGKRGEQAGELNFPTGVAADADGTLLVIDTLNFRVSRFSSEGRFLGSFGEAGDEEGQFGRPKGIASDKRGNVYVSDGQWDVVLVFDREGRFQYSIGDTGDGPGQLQFPAGVAVNGARLYVADSLNHRIEVFELLDEAST